MLLSENKYDDDDDDLTISRKVLTRHHFALLSRYLLRDLTTTSRNKFQLTRRKK